MGASAAEIVPTWIHSHLYFSSLDVIAYDLRSTSCASGDAGRRSISDATMKHVIDSCLLDITCNIILCISTTLQIYLVVARNQALGAAPASSAGPDASFGGVPF